MDSDRSSCDSLDEILNNLEDGSSDEDSVSQNNYKIEKEKGVETEQPHCHNDSSEPVIVKAQEDIPEKNISTDNVDKISNSSDNKNGSIVNAGHSKIDSAIENSELKGTETAVNNGEEVTKEKSKEDEINVQAENQTTKADNTSIVSGKTNPDHHHNSKLTKRDQENVSTTSEDISEKSKLIETRNRSILIETTNPNSSATSETFKDGFIITQYLDHSQATAEARLAARRAARAEAREIRMREVERQQREQEENADRQFDMQEPMLASSVAAGRTSAAVTMLRTTPNMRLTPGTAGTYLSSRRSSEDSLEDTGSLRDLRHELKDVEEKFRKAMIANAQLDNDKSSQTYQLELLKDRIEELEEAHAQLRREHRDKCRDHDQLQRQTERLKQDLNAVRAQLEDRDRLIAEKGLVIVGGEDDMSEDGSYFEAGGSGGGMVNGGSTPKRALVSAENAQMLEHAGEGSLDVRLAKFARERSEFQDIISHLRLELEEERNRRRKNSGMLNGPSSDLDFDDQHRVASKQLDDYKFRAQKAEQDVATLQANVARLESQVIRYKSSAEVSEKSEEALKTEKRKLQREDTLSSTSLDESSVDIIESVDDEAGTGTSCTDS